MNHSILVAGALLAPALALAQAPSSVTLYGIVDVGVTRTDPKAPGQSATTGVSTGNQSGSRWGVRGSESLGDGLRANFVLESGINVDVGTLGQGNRLFGRQAWAGLGGGFGELRLGRMDSLGFELAPQLNPFGVTWNDAGLQATFASADGLRLDNTVMYRSPNLAGFTASAGYSFAANASEVAGSGNNQSAVTAALRYAIGKLTLVATWESINCPDSTTTPATGPCSAASKNDQTHLQVGGNYDFGFARLFLAYGQERDRAAAIGGANAATLTGDADSYAMGVSVPLAGGSLIASYQSRSDETSGRASAAMQELDGYALGFSYPFSNRTNLWTYMSERKGDNALANSALFDRRQYGLGLRHTF